MDTLQKIAISKIADILSSTNLIIPQVDIWKKIFNNAGLSELYESRAPQFTTIVEVYGYGSDDKNLYHNEKCYNGLHESFKELEYNREELLKLFNNITEKISIFNVFIENIEKEIKKEVPKIKDMYIDEYLKKVELPEKNILLNKYSNKNFKLLRNNFNILALDICFDEEGLCVLPFTGSITEKDFDNSILMQWLSLKYPNIAMSYTDAIKAYSNSDDAACISHCRNIITGIFTYKKDEQRKWLDGLKKVCYKDKNIINVQANKIGEYNYNANSPDVNARYQYPRFNFIYKLYSFTCALGAHINEGNVSDATVDFEDVTLEDAFMALKATEAVLIWIYQTNAL
ncbi:MAG: hypothetical protein ABGU93_11020 [Acetobacterium sp.]|uniref:hypothetical protein n=1 Tax=Acetobacterium sp. TaxID=1872094 RepID=UPI003242C530